MNTTAACAGLRDNDSEASIPLKGVDAAIEIAGVLASTTITQRYRNDSGAVIEVVYAFPLPSEAILLGLDIEIGGRTLTGTVQPKPDAEERYEDAIADGDGAFLLRELDESRFEMRLGNLKAGETIAIRLRYAELLRWNDGVLRYRLPTVIAPHYGDPGRAGIAADEAPGVDVFVDYPFTLSAVITGALADSAVSSPTHGVVVQSQEGSQRIGLEKSAQLDRDFVLLIEQTRPAPWEVWYAADGDANAVLGSLLVPTLDADAKATRRDVTLVLDCSGSMMGDSIAQTRQALLTIIDEMRDGDRLLVTRFGSTVDHWFKKPVVVSGETRDGLRQRVMTLEADLGGTEIVSGIEAALKRSPGGADVLLITDGEAWENDETLRRLATRGHRFFTIGVGAAVSEKIVRLLADASNGAVDLVTPNESMSERVVAHFRRMSSPRASVRIDWGAEVLLQPKERGVVFGGDTVALMARLDGKPIRPTVRIGTEVTGVTFDADPVAVSEELAAVIPRVVAWFSLQTLDEEAALELAVKYQLLTSKTGMVAVLKRAEDEKASGLPTLSNVPQMLAAGWGGVGSVQGDDACYSMDMNMDDACFLDLDDAFSSPTIAMCMPSLHVEKFERSSESVADAEIDPIFPRDIRDLELSELATKRLKSIGASRIGDLIQLTKAELLQSPELSTKHVTEIEDVLAARGLSLGMVLDDWLSNDVFESAHLESEDADTESFEPRSVSNPLALLELLQCAIERHHITGWVELMAQKHWLKLWNDDAPKAVAVYLAEKSSQETGFPVVMLVLVDCLLRSLRLPHDRKRRLRDLRWLVRRALENVQPDAKLLQRIEHDFHGTQSDVWVLDGNALAGLNDSSHSTEVRLATQD